MGENRKGENHEACLLIRDEYSRSLYNPEKQKKKKQLAFSGFFAWKMVQGFDNSSHKKSDKIILIPMP